MCKHGVNTRIPLFDLPYDSLPGGENTSYLTKKIDTIIEQSNSSFDTDKGYKRDGIWDTTEYCWHESKF